MDEAIGIAAARCQSAVMPAGEAGTFEALPVAMQEYLPSSSDGLATIAVEARYPNLDSVRRAPETRALIVAFLRSSQAQTEQHSGVVYNCWGELNGLGTVAEELPLAEFYSCNSNPYVRVSALTYIFAHAFREGSREVMLETLRRMLVDESDTVRRAAPAYVQRIEAEDELGAFLREWRDVAPDRPWAASESYELVLRLL